jgi:phage I-like protein
MEELEQLLALLGVQTFAEAATAITRMNAFLADARERTGRQGGTSETLDVVRAQLGFARAVEASLGAQGGEAIARVEALKAQGERLQAAEASLQALHKAQGDAEAGALIAQATTEGRLAPAKQDKAQEIYAEYGVKALRTFLDCLPQASSPTVPGAPAPRQPRAQGTQPTGTSEGGEESADDLTPEELAVAKAMGKTPKAAVEAKKLWASSQGRMTEAELIEMNEAQARDRAKARQGYGAH